jgi:hypothetical protein
LSSTTSGASSQNLNSRDPHQGITKPLIQKVTVTQVRIGISSLSKAGFLFPPTMSSTIPPPSHAHLISTHTHLFRSTRALFCTILPMCNTLPFACVRPFPSTVHFVKRGCARVGMELSSVSRVPRRSCHSRVACEYSRVRYLF